MCDLLIRQQTLQAASVIGVLAYRSQSKATVSAPEVDVDETFTCCRGGSGEETVAMVEVVVWFVVVLMTKKKNEKRDRGTRSARIGESGFSSNGDSTPASQYTGPATYLHPNHDSLNHPQSLV